MKSLMRSWISIGLLSLALSPAAAAIAHAQGRGTPDGVTPAVEDVCTGLKGAAYGLCVAYCEANDCELNPDTEECEALHANYEKITGELTLPCEGQDEK